MKRNSRYYDAMKRMEKLGEQDFSEGKPITAFPEGCQFPNRARAAYEMGWRNAQQLLRDKVWPVKT